MRSIVRGEQLRQSVASPSESSVNGRVDRPKNVAPLADLANEMLAQRAHICALRRLVSRHAALLGPGEIAAKLPGAHAEVTALQGGRGSRFVAPGHGSHEGHLPTVCCGDRSERWNADEPDHSDLAEVMTMLHYNEAALVRELDRVGDKSRVAFAASCAERLFPAYEDFCRRADRGDRATLTWILARVWKHLLGDQMSSEHVRETLGRCIELIPGDDEEPWVDGQAYADDAASAIAYTLRALDSGESQEAAWAARRAYEAADHHVVHRLGIEGELQILAHPIVQTEFCRQRRDLEELLGAPEGSTALFVRLRDRAKAEASTFFVSHS